MGKHNCCGSIPLHPRACSVAALEMASHKLLTPTSDDNDSKEEEDKDEGNG